MYILQKGAVCYLFAMTPVVFSGVYRWIFAYFEADFNRACCKDSETTQFFEKIPKLSDLEQETCRSVQEFLANLEKLMTSAYVITLVSFLSCTTDVAMLHID